MYSRNQKLSQSRKLIFQTITKEKEIQNDKERILNKFKFSSYKILDINKSITSSSFETEKTNNFNKSSGKIKLTKSKISHKRNSSFSGSSTTKKNECIIPLNNQIKTRNKLYPYIYSSNAKSIKNFSSTLSNSNDKSFKNKAQIVSNILINKNFIETLDESQEVQGTENECFQMRDIKVKDYYNSENIEMNKEVSADIHNIKKKKIEKYILTGEEDYNNRRCTRANLKILKLKKLFQLSQKCDVSNRQINDEIKKNPHYDIKPEYKFIQKIKEENKKIPLRIQFLNIKKFLNLTDIGIYTIISFSFDNFKILVSQTNKKIQNKIILSFKNIFQKTKNNFSLVYKNYFQLDRTTIMHKSFIFNKRKFPVLNLSITSKIICKDIKKEVEFGYKSIINNNNNNNKCVENIWKIDITKKSNDKIIWFTSENESFKNKSKYYSYFQSILPFTQGDTFEININIFSINGTISPYSIQWISPKINDIPKGYYEKTMIKNNIAFDNCRYCEFEKMVEFWKSARVALKNNKLINEFKKIFLRHFIIQNIYYYVSKIVLLKICMVAETIGILGKNKFFNLDIEILSKDTQIFNEIQNIYLLNTSYMTNKIQVRKGTKIFFYIKYS